jgi:hypothetical protein
VETLGVDEEADQAVHESREEAACTVTDRSADHIASPSYADKAAALTGRTSGSLPAATSEKTQESSSLIGLLKEKKEEIAAFSKAADTRIRARPEPAL